MSTKLPQPVPSGSKPEAPPPPPPKRTDGTLHPAQIDALRNGATLLVERMERQPKDISLPGVAKWRWQPDKHYGITWGDWCVPTDESNPELFRYCPLGQPGDVLVVECPHCFEGDPLADEPDGEGGWQLNTRCNYCDGEGNHRFSVVSVAVKQLGEIAAGEVENILGCAKPFLGATFRTFYNACNPDHPWNANDWVWCAQIESRR